MSNSKSLICACIFSILSLGSAHAQSKGNSIMTNSEQINALDYRLQKHKPYTRFTKSKFIDNTFYSVFAGTEMAVSGHNVRHNQDFGSRFGASFGKWITPISGLRLSLSMGSLPVYQGIDRLIQQTNGVDIDYLVNLSAIAFNKDDVFRRHEFLGVFGLSYRLGILNDRYQHIAGIGLGLQYKCHLTESMSFFAEPRINLYTDNVDNHENVRGYNPLLSLQVGASYRMLPLELRKNVSPINNAIFANNTFISAGIGLQRINTTAVSALPIYRQYGPTLFFGYGKWFSGVSGVRLGANISTSWIGERDNFLAFGLKAEYLLNMNALVAGYNPNRKFELYALGGVVSSSSFDNTLLSFAPGLGMGVQANFNISPTENIYIEPRYDLYLENFLTRTSTTRYTNGVFSLVAGMTFKSISDAPRKKTEGVYNRQKGIGNRSLSIAAGGVNYMNMRYALSPKFDHLGFALDVAFSERFSPYSELRIGLGIQLPKTIREKEFFVGELHLDHLWDMTSYIYGYNNNRRFSMMLVSGVNLAMTTEQGTNFAPGVGLGFQARYQVMRGVRVFLEPKLNIYTDNYVRSESSHKGFDATSMLLLGVSIGPQYEAYGDWTKYKSKLRELEYIFAASPSLFIPREGRVTANLIGASGSIGVQYHVNPASSFRGLINVGGSTLEKDNRYFFTSLRADYILGISHLFLGYNPQRIFNLSAVLGISAVGTFNDRLSGAAVGIGAGIQGRFRVTDNTQIFIEPRVDLFSQSYLKNWSSGNSDMVASILAGVALKSKYVAERQVVNHPRKERLVEYFIGGGPELFGTYQGWVDPGKYLGGNGFVGVQGHFSPLSSIRGVFTLGTSGVPYNKKRNHLSLSADYLFNFSNFFRGYDPNRIFSVYGVIGVNASGITEGTSKGIALGGGIGVQGKVKIMNGFSLFIEPREDIYLTKPLGKISSVGRSSIMASVMVGASFSPSFSSKLPKLVQPKHFFDGLEYQLGGGAITMYSNPSVGLLSGIGPVFSFGVTKPMSYASAFRLSARIGIAKHDLRNNFTSGGLHFDYMFNLSNLFGGYNPKRIVSISGLIGVSVATTYNNSVWSIAPGAGAGLHADFALTDQLSIYAEPRTDIYTSSYIKPYSSAKKAPMLGSIEIGLKFKPKKSTYRKDNSSWNRLLAMSKQERVFIFSSVGASMFLNNATLSHIKKNRSIIGYGIQAGVGYQLTPFTQVQAGYSFIQTPVSFRKNAPISTTYNGLKLDYKLQIIPMTMGFDPNRLVNVNVILGFDIGSSSSKDKSDFTLGGHVGGELAFRVSKQISITATPTLTLFDDRWDQSRTDTSGSLVGDIKLGINYHF